MQKVIVCSVALFVFAYFLRRILSGAFDLSFVGGMALCLIVGGGSILIGFAVDRSRAGRR
jgi:hypothetical protein